MKLGLVFGYSGAQIKLPMDLILEAESLGFDSVWSAEAWGSDAVTPVAWVLAQTKKIKAGTAIMQMAARTPASVKRALFLGFDLETWFEEDLLDILAIGGGYQPDSPSL